MVHSISILGSTGSIGRQTVSAACRLGIPVGALTARSDVKRMEEQCRLLKPAMAVLTDASAAKDLRTRLSDTDILVLSGEEALIEASVLPQVDCVVTAVSGSVGLKPTLAAIGEKKRIALANKETLVCAGSIVMAEAEKKGAEIIPVDSEHSAIFQSLAGRGKNELKTILLTGSGGPFRGMSWEETERVTPEMAIKHPNWAMGSKISVDSATMMNKGLEFIEAMHLFAVTPEQIHVLIHPESAIHSAVELIDGTVIAQLATADMGLPIQYALSYPERVPSVSERLDFAKMATFHFSEPDYSAYPCLRLAVDCACFGGTAPCVLSAANEIAVAAFLSHKISYHAIYELVSAAVEKLAERGEHSLDEILAQDMAARVFVNGLMGD